MKEKQPMPGMSGKGEQMPSDGQRPPMGMMPPGGPGGPGGPPPGVPGGPRGPRGRMPGGTSMDPQTLEIINATIPDFPKWRKVFFLLDWVAVAVTFFLQSMFFFYFRYEHMLSRAAGEYFLRNICLPTAVNVLILLGVRMISRRLSDMDMRQNFIPILAMQLTNLVTCMSRDVLMVILAIFCAPICMTTVFSSKKMSKVVTMISIVGVTATSIKEFIITMGESTHVWIIPEGMIMIFVMIVMGLIAQTALSMTDGQRKKLYDYAVSIKKEQQRAEAANIAKSAFLANMSHEIRTPINAILGMNEMILRENQNEQIEEYARNINSAGSSLLYLVNDVLDISKIESGKLEIMESTYEISSFIHDCYNMIAEKAEKKGLVLKVDCNPKLPSQLRGDESRLRQVVTNLLSNAAKYTESGSITLGFDSKSEEEQFFLIISVRDTGIGIKEENLKELFSQFSRFDLEKNRNIEGTGLGLSITKRLIDLMNGDIQVQSIYGVGSSFEVTIPQKVVDNTPIGDFRERYRNTGKDSIGYHKTFEAPDAQVLVVDDVEVNLKVITNLLKATKVHVDTAKSGAQCLEMVAKKAYDMIFMDHMMPEMSGIETYAEMKKSDNPLNKGIPVVMLTANAISGVREQYLQEGFADYLSKPVSGDKLEGMLRKYLPKDKINTDVSEPEQAAAGKQKQSDKQEPAGAVSQKTNDILAGIAKESPKQAAALRKLCEKYENADIEKAMEVCGESAELYIDILKIFRDECKIEELKRLFEEKDMENYQILAHGVKSSAISSGFTALSEKAKAMEFAARDKNVSFIEENHSDFIAEYQAAVDAIADAVS